MTIRVLPIDRPAPVALSHLVLRTAHLDECVEFYEQLVGMKANLKSSHGAAISHDGEHHRIALIKVEEGEARRGPGLEHFAFKTQSLGHLLGNYKRLKQIGIEPFMVLHHGGTLSSYYKDPDGVQVEVFIDTLTADHAIAYMGTADFQRNPIGYPTDLDDLAARYEAGESVSELLKQPEFDEEAFEEIFDQLIANIAGDPD
jgi:catechol 2,3-dioxygenase-like lactoylglutathione lyase family enzyme